MTRFISTVAFVAILMDVCVLLRPKSEAFAGPHEVPLKSIAPKRNDEGKLGDRLKRPFIVYTRDYMMPCFANYVPTPEETEDSLRVEMASNEYEPVQFGIYVPSEAKAVTNLRIEVDIDIPHESGYLYYDDRASPWRPYDEGQWYTDYPGGRRVMPRFIVPRPFVYRIDPGQSAGYWITLHSNDRVRAGVHRGEVIITSPDGKSQRHPLEVVVRPFALPRPQIVFGLYYRADRIPGYWTPHYQKKYARDMKAHGMNSAQIVSFYPSFGTNAYQLEGRIPPPATSDGWIEPWLFHLDPKEYADGNVDPVRLVEGQIEMFQEVGLVYPDIPVWGVQENFRCANKAIVADTLRRLSTERSWPEILLMTRDEPPAWTRGEHRLSPDSVKAMLEWKRIRNARTFTALSGPPAIAWGNLHDIWIVMGGEITPEMVREARRQGSQVFTYLERIRLTNVLLNRYYSGLYTWGLGLDGNTPYCYCMGSGLGMAAGVWLPDHERPSQEMIHSYIVPGPKGPIPGVGFEGRREGVDDYRYLQLLEARIAAAAGVDSTVAQEADRWLADLKRRIEMAAIRGLFGTGYQYYWDLDWVDPQPDIDVLEYHDIRATAARYISELPEASGESNAPPGIGKRKFPSSGWEGEPFQDRSLDECLRALKRGSVAEQRAAANAILFKEINTLDPGRLADHIDTLARLLDQPEVRIPAMRALRAFGSKAAPALEALKHQLSAEDPYVRCGVLLVMESMGTVALDGFILGLEDPFPMNSVLAAQCLGRIGPAAAIAIPTLKKNMAASIGPLHERQFEDAIESISGG